MPDEAITTAPAEDETQDTPTPTDESSENTETPSDGESTDTEAPSHDWEQRYNDLRPEYDRSQQILAALQGRHGAEAQAEAAEMFGFEFEDDDESEDDDEFVDPTELKLTELEQKIAERERAEEEADLERAEQEWLTTNISELEKKESVELDKRERALLVAYATTNRFEDGQPDIEGAYKLLSGAHDAHQERYLASKRAPKVPVGSAGQKKYDPSDDDERQAYMKEVMEQASAEADN